MAKDTKSESKGTETKAKAPSDKATKKPKTGAEMEAKGEPKSGKGAAPKSGKPTTKRNPLIPRTYFAENGELVKWRIVDAAGQPLGRLSSYISTALMGKDKPGYTRHHDSGDAVVVINAKDVVLTGNKWDQKTYHYHTNYPGGIKSFTAKDLREKNPERLVERAVYGMLPKGHMGRQWYKKLRVFAGSEHPHKAQQPAVVKLPDMGTWEKA